MALSQALGWLCEPPKRNFTLSGLLRRGWPGFADVVLLPKIWELGRAARLVERVIFWGGGLAGIIYYGDLPLVSPGKPADFTDALVLLAIVKVIAVLVGLVVQLSLKLVAYLVGGFERVVPR